MGCFERGRKGERERKREREREREREGVNTEGTKAQREQRK